MKYACGKTSELDFIFKLYIYIKFLSNLQCYYITHQRLEFITNHLNLNGFVYECMFLFVFKTDELMEKRQVLGDSFTKQTYTVRLYFIK